VRAGSEVIIKQPGLPRVRRKVAELQPGRSLSGKPPSGDATAGGHTVERHANVAMITLTLRQVRPLARLAQALLGRRIHRARPWNWTASREPPHPCPAKGPTASSAPFRRSPSAHRDAMGHSDMRGRDRRAWSYMTSPRVTSKLTPRTGSASRAFDGAAVGAADHGRPADGPGGVPADGAGGGHGEQPGAATGACLRRPVSHSRRRVSLLSRSRCAGITGRPSQDVRETVLVVAEAPETEGCHG